MHNNEDPRNGTNNYHMMVFLKLSLLAVSVMFFKYYNSGNYKEGLEAQNLTEGVLQKSEEEHHNKLKYNKSVAVKSNNKTIVRQPTCPKEDKLFLLEAIRLELELRRTKCKPEDIHNPAKHKIPKHYFQARNTSNSEDQVFVDYLIGALLITSIGATLLELYRAKTAQNQPPNGSTKGLRAPPSRKCSLAELTVLKHQRKELVRRESIMEQARVEAKEELSLKQGRTMRYSPIRVD